MFSSCRNHSCKPVDWFLYESKWHLTHFIPPSIAFVKETSHFICSANRMTGFFIKCSTRLKWVKLGWMKWIKRSISKLSSPLGKKKGPNSLPPPGHFYCLKKMSWKLLRSGIYLFKFNSRNTWTMMSEVCSKLIIKVPVRRHLRCSLNIFYAFFLCFYWWLGTSNCKLGNNFDSIC